MNSIAAIIGPIYQKLLQICEKRQISLNLDLERPSLKIRQEQLLRDFLQDSLSCSIKCCKKHNKITISQSINEQRRIRFSIKSDGDIFGNDVKAKLTEHGYHVRSRFGYGNTISVELN